MYPAAGEENAKAKRKRGHVFMSMLHTSNNNCAFRSIHQSIAFIVGYGCRTVYDCDGGFSWLHSPGRAVVSGHGHGGRWPHPNKNLRLMN
jgi:hypothetical protein